MKKALAYLLIGSGLALLICSLAFDAVQYPWKAKFGMEDYAVQDPAPIALENGGSLIVDGKAAAQGEHADHLPGGREASSASPAVYVRLGVLKIPKLNISSYVLEGTERQLSYGAGHVPGSAGLGEKGNCVIAGHRNTIFRYLNMLSKGDRLMAETDGTVYTYEVYQSFSVLPDELWVLQTVREEPYTLTMITCTPYLISSHRLIVRARLVAVNGKGL